MHRHIAISGLRNLGANRLNAAIAIGGLTIGFWAAILAGLMTRNLATHDDFFPGSERVYLVTSQASQIVGRSQRLENGTGHLGPGGTHFALAAHLKGQPGVEAVARMGLYRTTLSHGDVRAREEVSPVDPDFFRVMTVPSLFGDPRAALQRPDGVVLTRGAARKYFGRDDARGAVLMFDHANPMIVRAVIDDFPSRASNIEQTVFPSARASFLTLAKADRRAPELKGMTVYARTLVRLGPGASLPALNEFATSTANRMGDSETLRLISLGAVQLSPLLNPGNIEKVAIFTAVAALILMLACLNFVMLSLARSRRRAVEVGVRKANGGGRAHLISHFLGEVVLQALLALIVAMMLVEYSLPAANNLLGMGAVFDWWRDPLLLAALVGGAALVGAAAGLYPALVLSAFRPAAVLKGLMLRSSASASVARQGFVTLQFAIPLVLAIFATVTLLQFRHATSEALQLRTGQVLKLKVPMCGTPFEKEAVSLPGVERGSCAGASLQPNVELRYKFGRSDGSAANLRIGEVDFAFFGFFGLAPVAGRLPDPANPSDIARRVEPGQTNNIHYVINEEAVAAMGFADPRASIGKPVGQGNEQAGRIIGVVRDFSLYPSTRKISPAAYKVVPDAGNGWNDREAADLHLRLAGSDVPQTLAQIDALWKRHSRDPVNRVFFDDQVQQMQRGMQQQGHAFALFAGVAIFLACIGLFGLSLAVSERRTKEIGVRKAMGADSLNIAAMLLWQFCRPVLAANLIAWPIAWWAMETWLAGFAYRIALPIWPFAAASALTVLVALLTVATLAIRGARQKPVLALRYE